MEDSLYRETQYQDESYLLLIIVLFLVMPLLGIFALLIVLLGSSQTSKRALYLLFVILALYLGCINSTKIPVTDQEMYCEAFKMVPQRNIWENLTGIYGTHGDATTKEMGYGLFNVLGYYSCFGNYALFIMMSTVLMYMLYYISIYRFFYYINIRNPLLNILSGVFILSFFTQFFNLTIHLERQYLATSFIIYALVSTIVKNKIPWIFVCIALSMHTSTGIFLPLFLYRQFVRKINVKRAIFIIVSLSIIISFISEVVSVIMPLTGSDIYFIERMSGMADSGREERMELAIVALVAIPMSISAIKNVIFNNKLFCKDEILIYLFYLFLILFALTSQNNTMQYRYVMMSYSFMPFLYPILFRSYNNLTKFYLFIVPFFLVMRFFLTFDMIPFDYAPYSNIVFSNFFSLFNYNNI